MTHETALQSRADLRAYGDNARLLFALEIRFQLQDVHTTAANSLTDDVDDKKCDLVYVDREMGLGLVAQAYEARDTSRPAAPSNKAADLNTAASWLLSRDLAQLPDKLRPAATDLRQALQDRTIRNLQLWYVHNLPESPNVRNELVTVENTVNSALWRDFSGVEDIEVTALEVGRTTLEEWYKALEAPILVSEELTLSVPGGYRQKGDKWEAYVTSVPAEWLYGLYVNHGSKLFSPNLRGYLGSRKSDTNINHGIKTSAQSDPLNFWVFNNGLTALVHDFRAARRKLTITGLGIVNGAQTTGAIGSLTERPHPGVRVQARFVKCKDKKTILDIIKYNNSQNRLEAADSRSNDGVQRRLRGEFEQIPDALYLGGRRGGHDDVIRRPANLLPSDTCAQALAIFHQEPVVAYNERSQIWISDRFYARYFSDQTTGRHIVLAYSLLKAIERRKLDLNAKGPGSLTEVESRQLEFPRMRGATFLLAAAIAKCMETVLGRAVPNAFRLSFGCGVSPRRAQDLWRPIVEATIPFCERLRPAVNSGLNNSEEARRVIEEFRDLVEATKVSNSEIFRSFAGSVTVDA